MTRAPVLDVEGPVTAEVFVLANRDGRILLTGPCGAAPWLIEAVDAGHPMALVDRMAAANLPEVTLVHSTSWRYERGQVVLTFTVVIPADAVGDMEAEEVGRAALARGEAREAPETIDVGAVLEHGLRHLAWLAADDQEVATALSPGWHAVLSGYVPAPFQQLGEERR